MIHSPRRAGLEGLIGAGIVVLTLTGAAAAQEPLGRPAAPDTTFAVGVFEEMQAQLQRLLPVMMELARSMEEVVPALEGDGAERPDLAAVARRAARFTRAYYDALRAEGFTEEQALRIVSGGAGVRRP